MELHWYASMLLLISKNEVAMLYDKNHSMVYLERKCVFVGPLPAPASAAANHERPADDRHAGAGWPAAPAGQYVSDSKRAGSAVAAERAGGTRGTGAAHGAELPPPAQRRGRGPARYHPCQLQPYLTHLWLAVSKPPGCPPA